MKKLFAYAATIAALFAAVSCSNKELEPTSEVVGETVNIRISSKSAGETKTGVVYNTEDKKHSPYWNKGDEIGVFFDEFTDKAKPDAILANTNEDKSQEAVFSAEYVTLNNSTVPGDDGNVYSFYPASAFQSGSVGDKSVRVDVKSTQTPAAVDTYDPQADILVGQPSEYLFDTSNNTFVADIAFARVMSVVKISLIAGTECPKDLAVNKLTMAAPEGSILTGRVTLSLAALYGDDSPLGKWTVENGEVSAVYTEDKPVIGGEANTVYVIVNPTSIESGDIVFTIDTDDYSIEKTVTLTKALVFPQSKVANIDLTIAGTNCEKKEAETRIWVENFDKVTVKEKQYQPDKTGATGTGVVDATKYDYGTDDNTNIRFNSNGHTSTDPYLFLRGSSTFTVSNIAVSEQSDLILSAQTKNAGTVTLKCKESAAEEWTEIGSWTSTGSFSEQKTIFNIASTATSIDLSFTASASIIIDDIVLEKFVDERTTLAVPANVKAEADANTSNKVNVTWDAVENAGSYEVTLSTAGEEDKVEDAETNSISFTGLKYSTQYSVKVKAISSDVSLYKDSEYTEPINVTTGAEPAVMVYYEKVTTAPADWCGDYLIVYETGNVAFDGSLKTLDAVSNTKPVEIDNNKILATDDMRAIQFTVAFKTGSSTVYSLRSASGKYISGTTTTAKAANGMKQADTDADYEITFNELTIESKSSDQQMVLKYNKSDGQTRFRFYKSGQEDVALYKLEEAAVISLAVSGNPTKTSYKAGDNFETAGLVATATYSDASTKDVTDDVEWTVTPTPLTAGTTSVSVVATYKKVSSEAYVVNGITVTEPAELTSISVKTAPTKVEYFKGEKFDPAGLVVYRNYSDETKDEYAYAGHESDFTFNPALTTALTTDINNVTITYQGKSVGQAITVKSIANTKETAYTVAQARALIDAGKDLDTEVYVKGKISEIVTAYSSSYGNISFNISANGSKEGDQFQFFRNFKGANKTKWTDADTKPAVGNEVIGFGKLTKYGSTYEFAEGNYIVSITEAPYLNASASKTSVAAAGETVTITVDTNVDGWTVTSDNAAFVVGAKSGNTVPVVVSENTSTTDGRTAHITVSATGVESKVITLTQSKKSSGTGPAVGTVMWSETWQGGDKDETPSAYGQEGTTVYNGGSVTYTQSSTSTKLYNDTMETTNLLLAKNNGTWTISGIPTGGQTKFTLEFQTNKTTKTQYQLSTTTAGVTIGTVSTSGSSSPYAATAEITISGNVATFDLTFKNTSTSNVRLDNLSIKVAE